MEIAGRKRAVRFIVRLSEFCDYCRYLLAPGYAVENAVEANNFIAN